MVIEMMRGVSALFAPRRNDTAGQQKNRKAARRLFYVDGIFFIIRLRSPCCVAKIKLCAYSVEGWLCFYAFESGVQIAAKVQAVQPEWLLEACLS